MGQENGQNNEEESMSKLLSESQAAALLSSVSYLVQTGSSTNQPNPLQTNRWQPWAFI